jgi:acetate kinase
MKCLVANIGSTSFKYQLLGMPEEAVLAQGRVERIGQPEGECAVYTAAIRECLADIAGPGKALATLSDLDAIAFKAVHAGPVTGARLINKEVLAAMEEFTFFAPAHNPPYMAAMRAFGAELPSVPLVALFETAFYESMSDATTTYAVPYDWTESYGIRRYGFHGASHRAASDRVQEALGRSDLRHISCHLGGSSSIAAIRNGLAVDTSFGISPQSGLPQNNRVGDIDAFAVLFMMKKLSLSVDEMAAILGSRSGLAGISGTSGDVRDLTQGAQARNARCRLALDVFVRAVRHYVGAFMLEMGGLDVLTFSGGIGENSAAIRAAVCKGLATFGIDLDKQWNSVVQRQGVISTLESQVKVLIVPANEEVVVARAAADLLTRKKAATEAS